MHTAALRSHARLRSHLEQLQAVVRRLVKNDHRQLIENEIIAARAAERRGDSKKAWRSIRKLSCKPPPVLPEVRGKDGNVATSAAEAIRRSICC